MNLRDIRMPVGFCFLWILLSEVQTVTSDSTSGLLPLDVTGVGNSEIYNNDFPLEKSLDSDPSTFYHAKSENDGWAKYSIPKSTVRLVRLQNRDSCCAERMTNNVVYVCRTESDDTCQECGRVTDSIGLGQWADITCDGLRGQFVTVQATNSYLQIAQIEVYADPKLNVDDLTKQSVSEGSSSTNYDLSHYALEKSLDDNPSTFFHAKSTTDGWAKYTIPESKVRMVRLQNRQDCCAEVFSQWKPLDLRGASSSSVLSRSDEWALENSWDNDPNTLFIASSDTVGWAKYKIDKSDVRMVRLLNRKDCCADRMTNNFVLVCTNDADSTCRKCGKVAESIGLGQWAEITCSNGMTGSVVKIQAITSRLQIAEIEIYADNPVSKNVIKVDVTQSTSSNELDSNKYPQSKSLDNDPATFFHAESSVDGMAKYNIPESNVRYVRLQNRQDCCAERMTNNKVYVCLNVNDNTCSQCGEVTDSIGLSQWATVTCSDGGLYGSIVKVQATNSYLQIAEIEVYADEQ